MMSKLTATFPFWANMSSAVYFLLFVVSLIFKLSNTPYEPGGETKLTLLRIATLIAPIIYFGKLTLAALSEKTPAGDKIPKNMGQPQLILLMVYFVLVFLLLCSLEASNMTAVDNINTLCVYVLPLLIFASFYGTYETWKGGQQGLRNWTAFLLMQFVLSFLYYTLFYSSISKGLDKEENTAVDSGLIVLCVVLVGIFTYLAFNPKI